MALDENAWTSVMLTISDSAIGALKLSIAADGDDDANRELKNTLAGYGLSFDSGFDVRWFGGSKQLFVRNTPEEVSKLKGLLMLFDTGFSVSKQVEKKTGEGVAAYRSSPPSQKSTSPVRGPED
jgi:hypothetical protein